MPNQYTLGLVKPIPPQDRFWSKVRKTDTCWLWTAAIGENGYGRFSIRHGEHIIAHRFSWILHFGAVPPDLFVLHRCDVRPCVRPDHLWLGTKRDNTLDMVAKGRHGTITHPERIPRGERNGSYTKPESILRGERKSNAVLTDDQAADIRRCHASGEGGYGRLAERFGVSKATVARIIQGNSWRHLLLSVALCLGFLLHPIEAHAAVPRFTYDSSDTIMALDNLEASATVRCIVWHESKNDPNAIGAAGEQGVAQLLPAANGGGQWNDFHFGDWVDLDPAYRTPFDPFLSVMYLIHWEATHGGTFQPWSTWRLCR